MWLFEVFWAAQSITILSEKKEIEIAGGHTGRRHKRKGSNLSWETEGRDVVVGIGLLASLSREGGKAHILPWGLQKEADTTHTSIAFLWPPGPQGDRCPLCKAAMFIEMYYRCLGEVTIYQDEVWMQEPTLNRWGVRVLCHFFALGKAGLLILGLRVQ